MRECGGNAGKLITVNYSCLPKICICVGHCCQCVTKHETESLKLDWLPCNVSQRQAFYILTALLVCSFISTMDALNWNYSCINLLFIIIILNWNIRNGNTVLRTWPTIMVLMTLKTFIIKMILPAAFLCWLQLLVRDSIRLLSGHFCHNF